MKKERHLTSEERGMLHKPNSDWSEGKRGDVCISACSLDVSDIIIKHKEKKPARAVGG